MTPPRRTTKGRPPEGDHGEHTSKYPLLAGNPHGGINIADAAQQSDGAPYNERDRERNPIRAERVDHV
jgi:hypothetical protein